MKKVSVLLISVLIIATIYLSGCKVNSTDVVDNKIESTEYDDLESWEKRAARIKKGMIEGMQLDKMPDIKGNFNAIINSTKEMDGYIVENIAIESFPGFYITGNLYRPTIKSNKYAAILTPHGHWEDRRFSDEVQIRSAMFARMGAIVFAYDMIGYGESIQVEHKIPIALLLQTWNSKRVLEYLLSRSDVDPDRIGMTGASGGGTQTFMLSALDDRIKAVAPVVMVSESFPGGCQCESGMPIHHRDDYDTNNAEIAALCAPRPLLLVSNGSDWTRNTPRVEYPFIRKIYSLYDADYKVENVHLANEVHNYGPTKRGAAYNFFAHYLKLVKDDKSFVRYDVEYNEDIITVLPKEELSVFGKHNPRPVNLLQGYAEIKKYLNIDLN